MTPATRLTAQAALATVGASTALSAVYADARWFVPVVIAVALVATVSELTRRSPLAAALGPVLAAGAVLLYLTAANAGNLAYAGFIPTGDSLRALGDLGRSGFDDIRTLTTPVPTHRGLVMLAVIAIAGVELVVDLIAVTLRRAALAGLPLLAVFAVCTSVAKNGVGWIPFAFGTAAYLWLLLVDSRDRIGRWGRTFGADSGTGTATATATRVTWADSDLTPSPLSALGRRIGVSAIAVGVVVPLLIPGLHGGLPKRGGGGDGAGSGANQVMTLNPLVNIGAQLTSRTVTPLIRVRTTDTAPNYLRLTALDRFDGTTFSPSPIIAPSRARVSHGLEGPVLTGPLVQNTISVGNLSVHWLPVPMQVHDPVSVKGDWRYEPTTSTIFSVRSDTQDMTFTTASVRYEPTPAQLDAAPPVASGDMANYLSLPEGISGSVYKLAQSITNKAPSSFRKALAIQNYLTSPAFRYDTTVSAEPGTDALSRFLLVTKAGFCQQYASAMAVLARMASIPSRVAVGFTHGTHQQDGSWLVTSHDAHAWPELYFPGFGWLPFEPTPRPDGQTSTPSFARPTAQAGLNDVGPRGQQSAQPRPKGQSNIDRKLDSRETPAAPLTSAKHGSHRPSGWWWLLAGLILLLLLPAPGLARVIGRRRRWASASDPAACAHAAWAELRAGVVDAGANWAEGMTPRAAGRLVAAEGGLGVPAAAALDRVVRAEERARYAAQADPDAAESLHADVDLVVHELLARQTGWGRFSAAVWPRSTMRSTHRVAERVADGLDLLDRVGPWVVRRWRGLLQPPRPRPS